MRMLISRVPGAISQKSIQFAKNLLALYPAEPPRATNGFSSGIRSWLDLKPPNNQGEQTDPLAADEETTFSAEQPWGTAGSGAVAARSLIPTGLLVALEAQNPFVQSLPNQVIRCGLISCSRAGFRD